MTATGPAPRSPRALGKALTRFARAHRPRNLEQALRQPQNDVHAILAIKVHDQLGDFVVATPALRALRARFPNATITLVTRPYLEPLARNIDAVDRVLVVPPATSIAGLVAFAREVRKPKPDVAVVLNSVSRSRTADAIAALSGARLVVGRSAVGAGPIAATAPENALDQARYEAIYDLDLPIARTSTHQVARVCDLLSWTDARCQGPPRLDLVAEQRASGREATSTIGIHPAAANPLKCWPVKSFVDLGAAIAHAHPGVRLIVIDTPKDPGPAHDVHEGLAARGIDVKLLAPRPLDELLGPLAVLDLLACNDSGMMHVAAALGTATLSFHSLGDPAEWAPRSERSIALCANPIGEIGVEAAVAAATCLLKN